MSQLTLDEFLAYLSADEAKPELLGEPAVDAAPDLWGDGEADDLLLAADPPRWDEQDSDAMLLSCEEPCGESDASLLAAEPDPWGMETDAAIMQAGAQARVPCPSTVRDFRAMGMSRPQAELWEHLVDCLSLNQRCPLPAMQVLLRAPNYRDRIMIMSFAYVNGCDGDMIILWYDLCGHFIDKPCRRKHLENLQRDIHQRAPNTCDRWYSYNMWAQQWEYLSGAVKER